MKTGRALRVSSFGRALGGWSDGRDRVNIRPEPVFNPCCSHLVTGQVTPRFWTSATLFHPSGRTSITA